MSRTRLIAALLAAVSTTLLAAPGTAQAAPARQCAPHVVTGGHYSYSYDNFDHGSEWKVGGESPGTLTMTRTLTASNTFSVSASVDVAAVSATVGFDVTRANAVATSYAFAMPADPARTRYVVQAGTRDDVYVFSVKLVDCLGRPTGYVVTGIAERTGYTIYRARRGF